MSKLYELSTSAAHVIHDDDEVSFDEEAQAQQWSIVEGAPPPEALVARSFRDLSEVIDYDSLYTAGKVVSGRMLALLDRMGGFDGPRVPLRIMSLDGERILSEGKLFWIFVRKNWDLLDEERSRFRARPFSYHPDYPPMIESMECLALREGQPVPALFELLRWAKMIVPEPVKDAIVAAGMTGIELIGINEAAGERYELAGPSPTEWKAQQIKEARVLELSKLRDREWPTVLEKAQAGLTLVGNTKGALSTGPRALSAGEAWVIQNGQEMSDISAATRVKAVAAYVDYSREQFPKGIDDEEEATNLGYMLAMAISEGLRAELRFISDDKGEALGVGVVAKDESWIAYPVMAVYRAMARPQEDNTILLTFNSLLAKKMVFPAGSRTTVMGG